MNYTICFNLFSKELYDMLCRTFQGILTDWLCRMCLRLFLIKAASCDEVNLATLAVGLNLWCNLVLKVPNCTECGRLRQGICLKIFCYRRSCRTWQKGSKNQEIPVQGVSIKNTKSGKVGSRYKNKVTLRTHEKHACSGNLLEWKFNTEQRTK